MAENKRGKAATGLTLKQEKFIQGLIKGKSQREAYRAAYNASKMTDKTVDEKACKLLADGKVRARYELLRGKVRDKAEKECVFEAVDVLKGFAKIARDDL